MWHPAFANKRNTGGIYIGEKPQRPPSVNQVGKQWPLSGLRWLLVYGWNKAGIIVHGNVKPRTFHQVESSWFNVTKESNSNIISLN